MRIKQLLLVSLTCAAALATSAQAQYPERAIKLVVPQAPGSATDNGARILAQELSKELGQSIIIENRPGGAFVIGNDAVAKAQPDGYTLLFGSIGAFAIGPHMVAKLPYDVERDFQPIAQVTTGHLLLAVAPSLPIHSVAELVEHAKKNPGKLSNASSPWWCSPASISAMPRSSPSSLPRPPALRNPSQRFLASSSKPIPQIIKPGRP
jgi:tripartite-type tricarboxylate transporter receptor subunit TctC